MISDVMSDPVRAVASSYERMGRTFHDEHARAIRAYIEAKPRAKKGRHAYRPEDWGFDLAALREHSRPYMEHFGVEAEV